MLADLLQDPSAAIVRAIMTRTVNQPSIPFQRQDEEVGTYMINAIRSTPQWATWRSSCQLHTWFVKQHKPGTHYTPLARLATSNCISKDGISYFATPAQPEQLEIVTRLRSGLMAGLSQHSLDSLRSHIPPQWTQATPRPRLLPKWHHPPWIQYLHPDIRVTGTLTFSHQNVYVTLDPWSVEAL